MTSNSLYYGDNLDILRHYVQDESVDLIYLDPPFKSDQTYNILFQEKDGSQSASQIKAFGDTWHWDETAARSYEETVEAGGQVAEAMQAFRKLLGTNDMLAYVSMMAPRLVELRRVLKPTGSLYLHCDPTASHYLKLLLDAILGDKNFRSEIHWYYYNKLHDYRKKLFAAATDTILFYVKDKTSGFYFQQLTEKRTKPVRQLKRKKSDGKIVNARDADGNLMYQVKTDRTIDNVWRIPCLQPASRERLGYPTQKPVALLERIIQVSSSEGDTVLDPFCGCGTTIAAAQKLDRRWIGIDITHLAISLIRYRMGDSFGKDCKFEVIGEPTSLPDAAALAEQDPYQFQWWTLGLVKARPAEQKKGADRGIDGRLYFHDEGKGGKTKQVIFSVKAGKVTVSHIRDLVGVISREKAEIGAFLSLETPTSPMRREAASAGFYESPWGKHPRIQLLTIEDLLGGKSIDYPQDTDVTFKKAQRVRPNPSEKQEILPLEGDSPEK